MTATLIGISVAFLVLTAPLTFIFFIQRTGVHATTHDDVDETAAGLLGEAVGNVMWMANNAVNFYLYLLTGSRYRAALADTWACVLCCATVKRDGELTASTVLVT